MTSEGGACQRLKLAEMLQSGGMGGFGIARVYSMGLTRYSPSLLKGLLGSSHLLPPRQCPLALSSSFIYISPLTKQQVPKIS